MISQLDRAANRPSIPGKTIASLNQDNEIIFKERSEVIEEDKQISKIILNRLAEEGVHPSIQKLVKTKLKAWTKNNTQPLNRQGLLDTVLWMNDVSNKIRTKSYITELQKNAKSSQPKNVISLLGINVDKDYDLESLEKHLQALETMGIDIIPSQDNHWTHILRYVNARILSDHENDILNIIDETTKQDPEQFLEKLKSLKQSDSYNHYVLDKLIAQAEVWQIMQNNPKLKDFPFADIWRFCMDVEFQKYGAYAFENEPGYMVATLKTLAFGLQLQNPTYLDCIELNETCGQNVLSSLNYDSKPLNTGVAHEGSDLSYGIYGFSEIDEEGLTDLRERQSEFFTFNPKIGKVFLTKHIRTEHIQQIQFLFEQHQKKIATAQDNIGERLIAHIWLAREISLQHHFKDGNGRTAQILLLSLLANDPYLPMMLLDTNPNLDTNGPVAFIKRVLQGMANFNKICGIDQVPLTFETIDEMTNVSEHRLWSHYHPTEEEYQEFLAANPLEDYEP